MIVLTSIQQSYWLKKQSAIPKKPQKQRSKDLEQGKMDQTPN